MPLMTYKMERETTILFMSEFRNIRKTDLEGVESMLTREDVMEKLRSGELTPQDIAANG